MIAHQVIGAVVAVAVVAPVAYAALDRHAPLIIESVDILTPEVKPGQPFIWKVKFNRTKSCAVRVESMIIDGDRVTYDYAPEDHISGGAIGEDERILSEVVPKAAADGDGEYYRYGEYKCNFAHEFFPVRVELFHLKFKILKEGEQP